MKRRVQWSLDALDDIKAQIAHIAAESPGAARRVKAQIQATGAALGDMATGRPGRVHGTYEKLVARLPYIMAYVIVRQGREETVTILRVIHAARHWPDEGWPT